MSTDGDVTSRDDGIPITARLAPDDEAGAYEEARQATADGAGYQPELAKLLHGTWLEEYKALRAEIVAIGTSSRQGTQVAIVALAAVISLAGYIVQNDLPILFLIAPFIFYALAWTQLRLAYTSRTLSDYIAKNIAAGIMGPAQDTDRPPDAVLNAGRSGKSECWPLDWEIASRLEMHSHRRRLWLIEASAFAIPVAVAVFLPGGYFSYAAHYHATISRYAVAYILINEVLCVYTVMMGSWMRRFGKGLNGYPNPVPNRYSDLIASQAVHYVWFTCRLLFSRYKPLPAGSGALEWYDQQVPRRLMNSYRFVRIVLWAGIIGWTLHSASAYNTYQRQYAKQHQSVVRLIDGHALHGIFMGYDGKNYVITVNGDKEMIDAALVKVMRP